MGLTISSKDSLRQSVEAATGGKNTVLYDDLGNPSIMVVIPRFNLEDIQADESLGTGPHPAFLLSNGTTLSEIFISKYENAIYKDRAISVPGVKPANSLSFDTALAACRAKGTGWHLMTNAEWAALALWCEKTGLSPRGNTNSGQDFLLKAQRGPPITISEKVFTLTGSGPHFWYHDNSYAGIADLNGNFYEWVAGLMIYSGQINIIPNNDAALSDTDMSNTSSAWKAISAASALLARDANGAMFYNYNTVTGKIELKSSVDNEGDYSNKKFEEIVKLDAGSAVLFYQLGLLPKVTAGSNYWQINNNGQGGPNYIMAKRGSGTDWGVQSDLFSLYAKHLRNSTDPYTSFRLAYTHSPAFDIVEYRRLLGVKNNYDPVYY